MQGLAQFCGDGLLAAQLLECCVLSQMPQPHKWDDELPCLLHRAESDVLGAQLSTSTVNAQQEGSFYCRLLKLMHSYPPSDHHRNRPVIRSLQSDAQRPNDTMQNSQMYTMDCTVSRPSCSPSRYSYTSWLEQSHSPRPTDTYTLLSTA